MTQKFLMMVSDAMFKFLEAEITVKGLDNVQETVKQIISQTMLKKNEKMD